MINKTLYKREMKSSLKMLFIFALIISLYVSIIISMYDPEMMNTLDSFYKTMPKFMASVGMTAGENTLIGFMISYLYGFILLIFPMLFCILRGNGLIAKYVEKGSMVTLLAAPVKRNSIVITQMFVLISGIFLLVFYTTGLEIVMVNLTFSKELAISEILKINISLLCLHLFIGSITFLASCIFSETKYSIGLGAGIPALMYIIQMLANTGGKANAARYFTFFSLFDARGLLVNQSSAVMGAIILFLGSVLFYTIGIKVFCEKDFHV
ncbi:hypothetical protein ACQRBF_00445 [Peptoniphilaceae bacterium SGI.131]